LNGPGTEPWARKGVSKKETKTGRKKEKAKNPWPPTDPRSQCRPFFTEEGARRKGGKKWKCEGEGPEI